MKAKEDFIGVWRGIDIEGVDPESGKPISLACVYGAEQIGETVKLQLNEDLSAAVQIMSPDESKTEWRVAGEGIELVSGDGVLCVALDGELMRLSVSPEMTFVLKKI